MNRWILQLSRVLMFSGRNGETAVRIFDCQTDGRTDRRTNRRMDGQTDKQTYVFPPRAFICGGVSWPDWNITHCHEYCSTSFIAEMSADYNSCMQKCPFVIRSFIIMMGTECVRFLKSRQRELFLPDLLKAWELDLLYEVVQGTILETCQILHAMAFGYEECAMEEAIKCRLLYTRLISDGDACLCGKIMNSHNNSR